MGAPIPLTSHRSTVLAGKAVGAAGGHAPIGPIPPSYAEAVTAVVVARAIDGAITRRRVFGHNALPLSARVAGPAALAQEPNVRPTIRRGHTVRRGVARIGSWVRIVVASDAADAEGKYQEDGESIRHPRNIAPV